MEAEEIALKKQLEASKDFEERKEIRQKLRKLRQQKLDALEAEPPSRGGRRWREERTERTTKTTSDGVTVTEKHTTKKEIVENGDVVKSEEDVVVKKEAELEPEPEPEPKPEPEVEAEEEPEVEQTPEEDEQPPEEDQEDDAGDVPFYLKKSAEDLTEQEIGEIDDLDFLEATLNDLPLKFFEVRKHLRGQIRKVKVNRGTSSRHTLGNVAHLKKTAFVADRNKQPSSRQERSREGKSSVLERTSKFGDRAKAKNNENVDSLDGKREERVKENGEVEQEKKEASQRKEDFEEEYTIEKLASDTLLQKLDDPTESENTEKERKDIDSEDDESSISSRSATSSASDLENAAPPSSNAKEKSGITAAPAHRIGGLDPGLQTKKTDFRSQLKKTGINPRMNIAVSGKISSLAKKDLQEPKHDLRKNLKSVPGAVPLTRRGSASEKYGPSLKERPKKDEVDAGDKEPTEGKRRISSADLFNLINKPKEVEPKDMDYSKQKGMTANKPVAQSYKYEPPKIVGEEDKSFQALMSQRKKEVKRQHTPADLKPGIRLSNRSARNKPEWSAKQLQKPQFISPKTASLSNDNEEDLPPDIGDNQIDEILKDVDVEEIEVEKLPRKLSATAITAPISPRRNRKLSSGNIKWVEGPQIDIQDKNQLSLLRQQLEEQKRQKEAGGTTITEEKTTTDGSTTTTTKTTENHGPGGSTTVTKTTTTTRTAGSGRAGARNIEAELARKKKERMSAKAAAFKNTKDQRNAFKEKLEAQNPKPAGGTKKSFQSPNTAVNALLEWCRRKTRGYGIDLQNYTTSWADGMAMCAIFHYFSPELVPWETLDPTDRKRNWTLAFEAAYAEGLDPILELEDVLRSKVPEPKSLITYVHSIYQHFHDKSEKAKLEKAQAAS